MKRAVLVKYLIYFSIAIIGFHFVYIWWSQNEFYPVKKSVNKLFNYTGKALFTQSDCVIHQLGIHHEQENNTFYFNSKSGSPDNSKSEFTSYLEVSPECTSLKQWLHWLFLMLIFPGPVKHKLWYLPLGIAILHMVNILRITGLAVVLNTSPGDFHFFHDYFFKSLFYFTIFLLWVTWVERFALNRNCARKH